MSKPSNDLSALFRSLRPDESAFRENTSLGARDAEQRWPLFKAVAPQKPQDAPALSEQERQRWVSQEKSVASARKPALSLPALSDKMSESLGKISGQAIRNIATVKSATRRESQEHIAESATEQSLLQPSERPRTVLAEPVPVPQTNGPVKNSPVNRVPTTFKASPEVLDARSRTGLGLFDKKPLPVAPALASVQLPKPSAVPAMPERSEYDLSVTGRSVESLKSIFSRLEAKPEAEAKPIMKRSSFLDRLGKR